MNSLYKFWIERRRWALGALSADLLKFDLSSNVNACFNINYDTVYFRVVFLKMEDMVQFIMYDRSVLIKNQSWLQNVRPFNKLSTVAILIMHGAGSPTSICNMRYYALWGVILSVQSHNGNTHFNINYDTNWRKHCSSCTTSCCLTTMKSLMILTYQLFYWSQMSSCKYYISS